MDVVLNESMAATCNSRATETMFNSRLMVRSQGYAVYNDLPGFQELRTEAKLMFPSAEKREWWEVGTGESRSATIDDDRINGQPRRHALSTPGGNTQRSIYHAPSLL